MLGDDDVYIQFAHLEADLRLVASQTSDQHVLYGLIMWKAYYNNNSMETSTASRVGTISIGPPWRNAEQCPCAGGGPQRYFLKPEPERDQRTCVLHHSAGPPRAVLAGHMDPIPPFPYINGPLFGSHAHSPL